jgi:hypothetical protein
MCQQKLDEVISTHRYLGYICDNFVMVRDTYMVYTPKMCGMCRAQLSKSFRKNISYENKFFRKLM